MSEKPWKKPARIKVAPNLFKVSKVYYYRRGNFEQRLGEFKNDEAAIKYKALFESSLDSVGRSAFQWKGKDAWREYITEREKSGLSEASIIEMKSIWLRHLVKHFGTKRLVDIDDVYWNMITKRLRVKDPTNAKKVLKTFLKWCQKTGKIRFVPMLEITRPERRVRKVLTQEKICKVLEHSKGNLLLFVSMYVFMGIRWSEQLRMRWENVNLENGFLFIEKSTSRTRKEREIPINPFVLELLKRRKEEQETAAVETPFLFPKRGNPEAHMTMTGPVNPWHTMLERAELAGLDLRPHDLRATYEHFLHLDAKFTDTQREKMVGAKIDIQRRVYVTGFRAQHLSGLEDVVQFEGLEKVLANKLGAENLGRSDMGRSREIIETHQDDTTGGC